MRVGRAGYEIQVIPVVVARNIVWMLLGAIATKPLTCSGASQAALRRTMERYMKALNPAPSKILCEGGCLWFVGFFGLLVSVCLGV